MLVQLLFLLCCVPYGVTRVAVPTPSQLAWQDLEVGAMITWNTQTFCSDNIPHTSQHCQDRGDAPTWDYLKSQDLPHLNTDQWVQAAASFGAKYAVLTADHFSGWALWPTKTYNYSIAGLKWKDGKGDVVADFVNSCKKYGLKAGVFYSVHDNWHEGVHNFKTKDPSKQQAYNELSAAQLTELLTKYGPWAEVWFDAGVENNVNPLIAPVVQKYARQAVCHSCLGFTQDSHNHSLGYGVRWIGNEEAHMPLPSWAASKACGTGSGDPHAQLYCPPSADAVLREHWWWWRPFTRNTTISTAKLVGKYLTSVGHAANLILNISPNTTGGVDESDLAAYAAFGHAVKCVFQDEISSVKGPLAAQEVLWTQPGARLLSNVSFVVEEVLNDGQLINNWQLWGLESTGTGWFSVVNSTGVGHKRILVENLQYPRVVSKWKFVTVDNFCERTQTAQIRRIGVYNWDSFEECTHP